MLPSALISVYQRYKADTDALAGWLALTAKSAHCPTHLLHLEGRAEEKKPPGRLKGKARRLAKQDQESNGSKHVIPIKSFIPLAEWIAAAKSPRIPVPASVIDIAKRAVLVRSNFSSRLNYHGAETSVESDETHNYFVTVLKRVVDILQPCMPKKPKSQEADSVESQARIVFNSLVVEEPSQEFLDAPDVPLPPKSQADDGALFEAETQTSLDDALAAYAMLLHDLHKIRKEIKRIWSDYSNGTVDVSAAAVASNTGIDLARYLIDQVLPLFEAHGGALDVGEAYAVGLIRERGRRVQDVVHAPTPENVNPLYNDVDETMLLAISSVKNREVCRCCAQYRETHKSWSELHTLVTDLLEVVPGTLQADMSIVNDFYSDLMILLYDQNNYPVEDESVRGIRELKEMHRIPFYLAFAAQLILDIHHTLGSKVSKPLRQLEKELAFMHGLIDKHYETKDVDLVEEKDCSCLRKLQRSIKDFQDDPTLPSKTQANIQENLPPPPSSEKHRILKLSPILCGIAIFHFRADLHDVGFISFNRSRSTKHAIHLYNALVKEGLVESGAWIDMGLAENFFGENNIFAGKKPSDTDGYLKQLMLECGMTVVGLCNMFSRLRGRGEEKMGTEFRLCKITNRGVPVSHIFIERYLKKSKRIDLRPEDVDKIISRRRSAGSSNELKGIGPAQVTSQLKQRRENCLSPHELLRPLARALTEESLEVAFPRLLMGKMCGDFLQKIHQECGPAVDGFFGSKGSCSPKRVVTDIFSLAVTDKAKGREVLQKAAEIVKETVASGSGSVCFDSMVNQFGLSRTVLEDICTSSKLAKDF